LFYGPLHFLLIREIGRRLRATGGARTLLDEDATVVDLGCGTGVAGAAWVTASGCRARVVGIDRHPWALQEAARTYRDFGISASVRKSDLATSELPRQSAAFLAAFTLNELPDGVRDQLMTTLLGRTTLVDRAKARASLLVVEPLAGFVAPWWDRWRMTFEGAGGRADEWRIQVELPPILRKLDRAAGLDHRELTGRSLWLGSST
jgi:hypothetical protein